MEAARSSEKLVSTRRQNPEDSELNLRRWQNEKSLVLKKFGLDKSSVLGTRFLGPCGLDIHFTIVWQA